MSGEEIDDTWIEQTDDPLVTYDSLTEQYIVKLDDMTVAEIYGGRRNMWAFKLAAFVRSCPIID